MEPIIPFEVNEETETTTPSSEQLSQTIRLAALGIRPAMISHFFSVSLPHLLRTCGPQIAAAARALHREVLQSLYEMAVSRRHPTATIFWLKLFSAEILPSPPIPPSSSQKPPKPEARRYNTDDTFDFDVYCNDGEPNADY
jgi:hypothetical protein